MNEPSQAAPSVAVAPPLAGSSRRGLWGIIVMSAALYFIQGIVEPVEGLGAQPVRSLLKGWGRTPSEATGFLAIASIPWSLKVFLGPLVDFVPVWGSRRRSYLILSLLVCMCGMLGMAVLPPRSGLSSVFLALLLILTTAVAVSDVASDALMVEIGQPLGLTGQIQSIQWTAMSISAIGVGYVGGWLSLDGRQHLAFFACGVFSALTLVLVLLTKVPEQPAPKSQGIREILRFSFEACRTPTMLGVGAFLTLWTFNPFSQSLLYLHMTQYMGFSEIFYGKTVSYMNVAATLASAGYGLYCRYLKPRTLLHGSIILGMVSTLAYCLMRGELSAILVTCFIGFTYQTAVMMQLDLAAQACPVAIAAMTFAILMAVSNLAASASTWVGGVLYERFLPGHGPIWAFDAVLILGTLLNASCWLLWPYMRDSNALPEKPQITP